MNVSPAFITRARMFRYVALLLATVILFQPGFAQESGRDQSSARSSAILMHVTVQDSKGAFLKGLRPEVFNVFDDKTPQDISFFSSKDVPMSIAVLFDTSGSIGDMPFKRVETAKRLFARFVQSSHQANEYFLIDFASQSQLILDGTRERNMVLDALGQTASAKPQGQTALYDACQLGIEKLARASYPKRVMILFSDGEDNRSQVKFTELRRSLLDSGNLFYALGLFHPFPSNSVSMLDGQNVLYELASITGGRAWSAKFSSQIDDILESLALELRHQYTIGFKSASDKKYHGVRVKVTLPSDSKTSVSRLVVRNRQGYYANVVPR